MLRVRAGFGVAEVLVAFTVLSTGVLAVVGVAGVAAGHLGQAEEERRAARFAARVADSLSVLPEPGVGAGADGALVARWTLAAGARGQRLRVEVALPGGRIHAFETFLAPPPPRLEVGW